MIFPHSPPMDISYTEIKPRKWAEAVLFLKHNILQFNYIGRMALFLPNSITGCHCILLITLSFVVWIS